MDPVVKKENWDKFWNAETTTRFTKQSWSKIRIMQTLDPFLRPEMNVLDAGSGSGFFSNYFLSKGCRVWSLDYSEASLAITRKSTSNQCQDYLRADLLEKAGWGLFKTNLISFLPTDYLSIFLRWTKDD